MPNPQFAWSSSTLRFRSSRSGRFVADQAVRDAVSSYTDAIAARMAAASDRLASGKIGADRWQRIMREQIKDAAVAGAMMGSGGRGQLTAAQQKAVEAEIRFQYEHLRDLAADIRSGKVKPGRGLSARAAQYAGAGTKSFEAARRGAARSAGYTRERRVLGRTNNCPECLKYERRGWVAIGTLPGIGERCSCKSNCGCRFEYRVGAGVASAVAPTADATSRGAEPREYGPSRATVKHTYHGRKDILAAAKGAFGRDVTLQEIASAAGAPHDATVEIAPGVRDNSLDVYIKGPGYTMQREVVRSPSTGKTAVKNNSFFVEESHQGKGIGSEAFGRQVEQASKLGVSRLDTHAAGRFEDPQTIGSRVWPRMGYDGSIPPGVILDAKEQRKDPLPYAAEKMIDLMRTKEGREWWDRNRRDVDLSFDLTDGSLSRRVHDGYRAEKADRQGPPK